MVFFLPSEVARLVLGYLKENNFTKTYSCLLKECPHLREYYQLLKTGTELETSVLGFSLLLILEEWGRTRNQGQQTSPSGDNSSKTKRKRVSPHSVKTWNKKSTQRTSRSPRSKKPSTFVLLDSLDDTADSVIESDDGGGNIPEFSSNAHDEGISSEDNTAHPRLQSKSYKTTRSSKKEPSGIQKQNKTPCKENTSPRKQHNVQFSESLSNITLLKSDNPGKAGTTRTGDKDKYPNLMNLLQVNLSQNDARVNSGAVTVDTQNESVSQTCDITNLTRTALQNPSSGPSQCNSVTNSSCTGQAQTSTSPLKKLEKDCIMPHYKTPSKSSKSPQKANNFITPVKLLQFLSDELNNSARSPRRKKPKTPRKRNSDVSPTNIVKEASSSENKLPLFQQVLSDKRLHEKLAETCNIVSGQLKLSISGSSNNGDKEREVTPPRAHGQEEMESVTASKSLEEILDMDTNYANEFLSENIDMTDPAFDCLFKLFRTDKESFGESIRKENQHAETETEKLTKDLEELERSIHEEFGAATVRETAHQHQNETKSSTMGITVNSTDSAQQENVLNKKDTLTGSQDLFQTPSVVEQPNSQPASPYISQAVCHSPYVSGDGVNHCMSGDGANQFTPLLRGHELGSSPAHSTPSRKSTYSSSQFIASPASIATQPFSPCHASSPASHNMMSPGSYVNIESPGTPLNVLETPHSQMSSHQNSPNTSHQLQPTEHLQHTPSHRHCSNASGQSTPLHSHQLPPNCSPLVKGDLLAGSPIMSQKDGFFTPQAQKRIFNPINSSQILLSPQMHPLTQMPVNDSSVHTVTLDDQSTMICSVTQHVNDQEIYNQNTTLTTSNVNCQIPQMSSTNHSVTDNTLAPDGFNTVITLDPNNHPSSGPYFENSGTVVTSDLGNEVVFTSEQCSTIANTIGCISLPQPVEESVPNESCDETKGGNKKKRSTRCDKGKKRKKILEKGKSESSEAPVLKGLLSKAPEKPKLMLNTMENAFTLQDLENQELVMLSPGGSSTLKIPILSCIDAMSSPGHTLDSSFNSVTASESEKIDAVSLQPDSQVTSSLLKSIASGNSSDIIKEAKSIADDKGVVEKKKVPTKKKKEDKKAKKLKESPEKKTKKKKKKDDEKAKKAKESPEESSLVDDTIVCGNLQFEPGEMLTATPVPVEFDMKKIHVRMLDFEQQFRKIQPKPSVLANNKTPGTVIIVNSALPSSDSNMSTNSVSMTTQSDPLATAIVDDTQTETVPTSSVTSVLSSVLSANSSTMSKTVSKSTKDIAKTPKSIPSKPQTDITVDSPSKKNRTKKGSTCDLNTKTTEKKNMKLESPRSKDVNKKQIQKESPKSAGKVTEKRCTRSSKPAVMERLDDKGMPETVKTDTESKASKSTSGHMGNKMYRRKPKGGKDMRVIRKHLASMDEEDDVFSTFSENSMDSLASIKSPLYAQSETESQTSECKYDSVSDSKNDSKNDSIISVAESVKEDKTAKNSSPKSALESKSKPKQKVKMSKPKRSTNEQKFKASIKPTVVEKLKRSSHDLVDQSDSSEDNVPLSKLKDRLCEQKTDQKEKEHDKNGAKTPVKCPASPRMTSPTELLTPSKESWMERVGLTPTKLTNLHHEFMSPGRPNPLDVLAVCQNSPLSDRQRLLSPNTRNRFSSPFKSPSTVKCRTSASSPFKSPSSVKRRIPASSPFKSPSSVKRRTPAKKLFDSVCDTNKEHTKTKVDAIIKTLQNNNPKNDLVWKVEIVETETDTEDECRKYSQDKADVNSKQQAKSKKESKKNKKSKKSDKEQNSVLENKSSKSKSRKSKEEKQKEISQAQDADGSVSILVETHEENIQNSDAGCTSENNAKKRKRIFGQDETTQECSAATAFLMRELETEEEDCQDRSVNVERCRFEVKADVHVNNSNRIHEAIEQNEHDSESEDEIKKTDNERTVIEGSVICTNRSNITQSNVDNSVIEEQQTSSQISGRNIKCVEKSEKHIIEGDDLSCGEHHDGTVELEEGRVREDGNVTSVRTDVIMESDRLSAQHSGALSPTAVEPANGSSSHHHHKHSGKKKKKKSKKRRRDESLDGESEERHKKKRKKHDKSKEKSKEKRHKKHRKSTDLSSLNVDAALSQLYTSTPNVPADSPYRTPQLSGHASPVSHVTGGLDLPLEQSTPIINNNLVKHGAFGTMFSPVTEPTN